MKNLKRLASLSLFLFFFFHNSPASGKEHIDINSPSFQKSPIAIADFKLLRPGAETGDLPVWFAETLARELLITGYFNVIDRKAFLEDTNQAGITAERTRFMDWVTIGAKYLIKGGFQTDGLHLVTEFRLFDVLKGELIVGKRYVGKPDDKNRMVMQFAKEVLQALMRKTATSAERQLGVTDLIVASTRGYRDIVIALIQKGTKVDAKDEKGFTALQVAAYNGHKKIVEDLIDAGANINLSDNNDVTPLMTACINNKEDIVIFLLKKGANPNLSTKAGGTALIAASEHGYTKIVKFLLDNRADVKAKDSTGQTALSVARLNRRENIVKLLVEAGAKEEAVDSVGEKNGKPPAPLKESVGKGKTDKESLYTAAYELFREAKYEKSREGFENILKMYPDTEFSVNAQFWIGECYYFEKKYEKAIIEYDKVVKKYPEGNKVPFALLKQGLSFEKLGDKASARLLLQQVIRDFPNTSQSRIARAKLLEIK